MRKLVYFASLALAVTIGPRLSDGAAPAAVEDGFTSLFNGSDLTGWEGNAKYWTVRDGAITGTTTAEAPLKDNTFLSWRGVVQDFELRLKFRIQGQSPAGANSGIQYRSSAFDFDNHIVGGYQADIDSTGRFLGILYDERGRGILAQAGEEVKIVNELSNLAHPQKVGVTATAAQLAALKRAVATGEWMDYTIIADGSHLQHFIAGIKTVDVIDDDPLRRARAGLLALQLHVGAPMTVQFKDIRLNAFRTAEMGYSKSSDDTVQATPAESLQVMPGFKAELIYSVPNNEQGSWVALTVDAKGRLVTADQYGAVYRITPPPVGAKTPAFVERLPSRLSGAQGLLYAFDSLYVMVNETPTIAAGIWRLRDLDGDDKFDETKLILPIHGRSEHGPHNLVKGADGRSIYFTAGNYTAVPDALSKTNRIHWGEDQLLPRIWDPSGHAKSIYAPGGFVGRIGPNGENPHLFAMGFRNAYDIAFDTNGELFTYDSDMEFDQGLPWYMPTRIEHVVDGGDYGWRSGSGRWPAYYEDSLPSVVDVGPGSPTGMTFGAGAKFPAKYQRALFGCDWTFGTMYVFHPDADGASFRAKKEEFLSGKPLALTDVAINPHDGAMYFIIGGRMTQSALYRVTYVGKDSTAAVKAAGPTRDARLRRGLETLRASSQAAALTTIWKNLGSADRFVRYTARMALEQQPLDRWIERALAESDPQKAIGALTALARVGDRSLQPRLLQRLSRIKFASLKTAQRLQWLRAWQLAFTRMGRPDAATLQQSAQLLDPLFPTQDAWVNRELAALLVYLDSDSIVAKLVPLLKVSEPKGSAPEERTSQGLIARNELYGAAVQDTLTARPDRQQIGYAYILRHANKGWTAALRRDYFSWFAATAAWNGGVSFHGILADIRSDALNTFALDPGERQNLEQLSQLGPTELIAVEPYIPAGPGRAYTVDETIEIVDGHLRARNFSRGQKFFAANCMLCHRFRGAGGGIGPDLTTVGRRFGLRDVLESIIEPSKVVSDQYKNIMPPGLLNSLGPDEVRDALAYILAGGNPNDAMFRAAQ